MSMRNIYRKIAKKHGVTVSEVKKDMQYAIEYAYKKSDISASEKEFQSNIKCKNEIPTPNELIEYAVNEIRNQNLKN